MASREQGRRVKTRVDSAGLAWADGWRQKAGGEAELSVLGIQCDIFQNTGFDPLDHLLSCLGDDSNQVDRFDGRLLLEEQTGSRTPSMSATLSTAEDASEAELDAERYADLSPEPEAELQQASADLGQYEEGEGRYRGSGTSATMAAVPFSYEDEGSASTAASSAAAEVAVLDRLPDEPFQPSFSIPEELAGRCPETEREHKIIAQTAKFVREAAQIEFVLRVKQSSNPNFNFLSPQDRLHSYFRWLVDANPEGRSLPAAASSPDPAGSALSMLSKYGSDSLGTPTGAAKRDTLFQQENAASTSDTEEPHAVTPAPDMQLNPAGPEQSSVPSPKVLPGTHEPSTGASVSAAVSGEEQTAGVHTEATPPASVVQIMEKLVGFIKRSGAKFEASVRQRERSNPRFAFLQSEHEHHLHYRKLVRDALGADEAEAILPPMPRMESIAAPILIRLPGSSTRPSAAQSSSASPQEPAGTGSQDAARPALNGEAGQSQERRAPPPWLKGDAPAAKVSALRANPSVLKGILKVHGPEPNPDAAAPPAAAAVLTGGAEEREADGGNEATAVTADDAQALEAAEGNVRSEQSAAERASEKERKAQRRRLARELLLARRQQQAAKEAQERKKRVNDIVQHRNAFIMDEGACEAQGLAEHEESGGVSVGALKVLPLPAETPALPKLEDILQARRQDTTPYVHQMSTLSPEREEHEGRRSRGEGGSGSDSSKGGRQHRKSKRKRRHRSHSNSTDGSSHSDSPRRKRRNRKSKHASREREDESGSGRRGEGKRRSKGANRSQHSSERRKGTKKHRRKENSSDDSDGGVRAAAAADTVSLSDELRARVRALLG